MAVRLVEMALEAGFEHFVTRLVDHARQRLRNLLLGIIDIPQRMDEEIVERRDILGEKSHGLLLMNRGEWGNPATCGRLSGQRSANENVPVWNPIHAPGV